MANEHTRLLIDPDTGETVPMVLSDEDAALASTDETFLRTVIQNARTAVQTRKGDLDELRGTKITEAIQNLTADIANFDTASAGQRLTMQKQIMRRQLVMMKALWRLIDD